MKYFELNFTTITLDQSDILIAYLSEIGFDSFSQEDSLLKAYIPQSLFEESKVNDIISEIPEFKNIQFVKKEMEDINWNAEWEKNFNPVYISDKCIIRAPFHNKPSNILYDIIIEPKMSFGTGHHETTYQMLEYILEIDFTGKIVLDMGCGSGILSMLAALKNAYHVIAIDNDEWAYTNSLENIEKNSIKNIDVILGDVSSIPKKSFDIILANINRNILLQDMKHYVNVLNEKGLLILSGFYKSDMDIINNEAIKYDLTFTSFTEKNNWVITAYKKK